MSHEVQVHSTRVYNSTVHDTCIVQEVSDEDVYTDRHAMYTDAAVCNDYAADMDVIEVDMTEEAKHRVYFGFFNLSMLDAKESLYTNKKEEESSWMNQTRSRQNSQHYKNGGQYSTDDRSWRSQKGSFNRYQPNKSLDRASKTYTTHSSQGRLKRDTTAKSINSVNTNMKHSCSLYKEGAPADYGYPCPGYGSYKDKLDKKLDTLDYLDYKSERLKTQISIARIRKHRQLQQLGNSGLARQNFPELQDRPILPRYDQPRAFMNDGTVVYQDQVGWSTTDTAEEIEYPPRYSSSHIRSIFKTSS